MKSAYANLSSIQKDALTRKKGKQSVLHDKILIDVKALFDMKQEKEEMKSTCKDVVIAEEIVCIDDNDILPMIEKNSKNGTFENFDKIDVPIKEYEEKTGITLGISQSVRDVYRNYVCKEHIGCPFFLKFGRRRRDSLIVLKTSNTKHMGPRRGLRAKGGRRWKKRNRVLMKNVYGRVITTKSDPPQAADMIKTAATMLGEDIKYFPAYRKLRSENFASTVAATKAFELISPYLEKFNLVNPGATTHVEVDNEDRVVSLFVCPAFMNNNLKYVRPVISLDSAHLRSSFKGGIQIYSGLNAADEVYIYAFALVARNECFESWQYSNKLFSAACPILQQDYIDDLEGGSNQVSRPTSKTFHDATFMSDRDKGLGKSLDVTFPQNHSSNCSHHIKMNVKQKFGITASKDVIGIARTFSTRQEEFLLAQVQSVSPKAHQYLCDIPESKWRSTEWLQKTDLPPRYGITTSNSSESVNSMIEDFRNDGWMELVDGLLDHMTNMISEKRQKYKDMDPENVVPKVQQILKKRWDDAASMKVCEIEETNLEYKVSEEYVPNENDDSAEVISNGTKKINHVVFPEAECCTCGKWQDSKYPCRHAVAYFRKWMEKDLRWILDNKVHYYFKYKSLHLLYENNIFPVILDNIRYDGKSKPPPITVSTGRPKMKRYRKRSRYVDSADSPILCRKCGERGHNIRTCSKK